MKRILKHIENFFLAPASAKPLGVLRILLALTLIYQALMLRASAFDFLSHDGLVKEALVSYLRQTEMPSVSTFFHLVARFGISEDACIHFTTTFYMISLVALCFGFFSRTAALGSWFFHWVLINTAYSTSYGVDLFAHVFLFYMIWMPIGDAFSIDAWRKGLTDRVSPQARIALRVLQLHLCIVYFASGIEKAGGPQWWNGELMWRAVTLPEYAQYNMTWLANWPLMAKIGGWSTLFFEISYCVFIWPKKTRAFWVASIVALHMGIAIFLGLTSFGLIMAALTLAVFGVNSEPTVTEVAPVSSVIDDALTPNMGRRRVNIL